MDSLYSSASVDPNSQLAWPYHQQRSTDQHRGYGNERNRASQQASSTGASNNRGQAASTFGQRGASYNRVDHHQV